LGRYKLTIEAFTDAKISCTTESDDIAAIKVAIQECRVRIEESMGKFNLDSIWGSAQKKRGMVDCAEFVHGSIRIDKIEGKGVGVVAKENIEAGTLIVVSRAVAIVREKETPLNGCGPDSDCMPESYSELYNLLVSQVVNRLCFEPPNIGIFTLYDNISRLSTLDARRE
jgi:hypothetical protein